MRSALSLAAMRSKPKRLLRSAFMRSRPARSPSVEDGLRPLRRPVLCLDRQFQLDPIVRRVDQILFSAQVAFGPGLRCLAAKRLRAGSRYSLGLVWPHPHA